ncbi:bZIP transcription factor HapX [Histoplasma capsulatum G186AR]|uniref:BZIP transcription factor HapX n=2 Tax=Ajellomyces capsulatus TaxID=5037 RepID=C0NTR9_AJECG|nr:bZIP transcription factor HapX [Histoplasma capsulatum G186AR]EEH05430.1 bZIP transcription factor HapX [Histoplasma capsulatum G186AR]KAG5305197.1 bZIP transcription factor HapX [Histoplasma capsulatum]QSS76157.1 bZIP transcription factor HapX [Histoplasma capsulatum G186AR]
MLSSSTVSTPSSISMPSPAPLAPAVPSRQPSLAADDTPTPATLKPTSITSKEWVIPPRPKPGRKPATDTPPTKRKAQNRAAQRAFRERRAARVGELEEQLRQIEEENERQSAALKERIDVISCELEQCKVDISWWKKQCQMLENNLAIEKHAKDDLMRRVKLAEQASGIPEMVSACENCSATRCQCVEEAFRFSNPPAAQQDESPSKRSHSPNQTSASKRHRPDIIIKPEPEELETDFTALFSTNRDRTIRTSETSVSPSRVIDPCGFCQDGTPCVCAEMVAEEENNSTPIKLHNRLTIRNLSQFTPPPSEGDVLSEPLHSNPKKANPCINGPGTCAQCKADPKSTLFCKSLAASRATSAAATTTSSGCCGGGNSRGGCCQSHEMNTPSSSTSSTQRQPISLSCADTYTALSRHPNFSRATDDLNTWLPRLHTLPTPRDPPLTDYGNRPAMEVEAASVMGVLKYFDRRFAD